MALHRPTADDATRLTAAERRRLIGALGLLASDRAGERDAAALAASRIMQGKALSWDALIASPALPPPQPLPYSRPSSRPNSDLEFCGRHIARLNAWETNFVVSLAQQRRGLTPGQKTKLREIAAELRSRGLS